MNPLETYERRLANRRSRARSLLARERLIGNVRLAVFLAGLALAAVVVHTQIPWAVLLLPLAAFVGLILFHDTAIKQRKEAQRAVSYYEGGMARLNDAWVGLGIRSPGEIPDDHPYAADLDLFGEGSLFELLCTCRTRIGQQTLARWLLAPATPEEIAARQQAMQELQERVDLREQLAVMGETVDQGIHPQTLISWGNAAKVFASVAHRRWIAALAAVLSIMSVGSLLSWAAFGTGPVPFLLIVLVQWGFGRWLRDPVAMMVSALEQPREELLLLGHILRRIETEPVDAPWLRGVHQQLASDGRPAWESIGRLSRLADLLEARRNQFFVPIGFVLHWNLQLALRIEAWRLQHGPHLAAWLQAIGDFESIAALSGYAFENPRFVFPKLVAGCPSLHAKNMGHPLLPRAGCVHNDVDMRGSLRLLIVSGSNMSGKSTFLRTVGINMVLAFAGAPVRAATFEVSPFQVGATLRIQDSLQEGASRFYAEIKRLRQIVDLCDGPLPVFFLLDEILAGTNSHDRRIGAASIIKGLLERGAMGLVTTHDLALSKISDDLHGGAKNVHFEDTLTGGTLHFDYTLREGVVQRSNALALMRAIGLEV